MNAIERTILDRYPILKGVKYVDAYEFLKRKGISTHRQTAFREHLKKMFVKNRQLEFYLNCLEGKY
jgi:hypothetical protein